MPERVDNLLLDDMLEAINRINSYTSDMYYDSFILDTKTSDAVLRNIQIIGEAANRVSKDMKDSHPEIEWSRIIRSRHILVHDYFGVDFEIVWRIIKFHLPDLKEHLDRIIHN